MEFGLYQHYKGKFYQVYELAKDSETLEEMVVYQALYGDFGIWVRPKAKFDEMLTLEKGTTVPRFALVLEDEGEDDEADDYLTVFDNELEAKQAAKKLKDHHISFDIVQEELAPKPKHLRSNLLYKLIVDEEDVEASIDALAKA